MIMSEQINELATAMAKAQAEVENASKNAANPHFKSKYADLAEVLNTVRPVFSKHGLAIIQSPGFADGLASITTTIAHSSGQYMTDTVHAPVGKMDAQGVGSALTYLRRYSLAAFAGVAQEDDDGNAAAKGKEEADSRLQAEQAARKAALASAMENFGDAVAAIKMNIDAGNIEAAAESWFTMEDDVKAALWVAPSNGGPFTTAQRQVMASSEFRKAYYGDGK